MRSWSEKEIKYLKDHYQNFRAEDIAQFLNRPVYSIYNMAYNFGLRKSEEFKKSHMSGQCH